MCLHTIFPEDVLLPCLKTPISTEYSIPLHPDAIHSCCSTMYAAACSSGLTCKSSKEIDPFNKPLGTYLRTPSKCSFSPGTFSTRANFCSMFSILIILVFHHFRIVNLF